MKRTALFSSLTVALFCFLIIFGAFSPVESAAKTVKLTYSNFFPPTHIQSKLAESWCQEVEKRTDGRVTIQYFPGQTLTKAKQTYDSVVDAVADIGFSVLAYTRGRFPVMSAVDLPFGYTSGQAATNTANTLYSKFKPKEFDDVKLMYLHAHGPGMIHTRKTAVRKLEDLKGLKIKSTGISAETVKALGGTPVPMPMPETYQALQKGVVDGGAFPAESCKGWKLGEVVHYATYSYKSAYTTTFFVAMNKDKWASLSSGDQKIIEAINKEWSLKHGLAWDSSDMAGIQFFLQQGNVIYGLDAKESARWEKAVAPMIDDYGKTLDKKGLDGQAIIKTIRDSLK